MNCSKYHSKKFFFFSYTLLFLFLFSICHLYYYIKFDKSFIWHWDGIEQQYTNYVYIGKWLRQFLHNIVIDHSFIPPMFDMSIGYGSDIFISLGQHLLDPFNWSSALFYNNSELGFCFIVFSKIYLSGIAFGCLCLYKQNNYFSSLIGTLIYTFSGSMFIAFKQMPFICIFYLFPIIIIGFDKIWNNKRPYLYIVFLFISLLHSWYFTYMFLIMLVIFFIVLSFTTKASLKETCIRLIKYILFSGIGGGMALGIILPSIMNIVHTDRMALSYEIPFHYSKDFISSFLQGMLTSKDIGNDTVIGISIICIIAIALLIVKRNSKSLLISFLLFTAAIPFPLFGYIFNGFSYPTTRWLYIYPILLSYITVKEYDKLKSITPFCSALISLLIAVYGLVLHVIFKNTDRNLYTMLLFMFVCIQIYLILSYTKKHKDFITNIFTLSITIISIVLMSYFRYDPDHYNFTNENIDKNSAYSEVTESGAKSLIPYESIGTTARYESYGLGRTRNSSMLLGLGGYDFYNSLYNNDIDKFHNSIALVTDPWAFGYNNLDKRSELEYLFGTKYCITKSNLVSCHPFGYNNQISQTPYKEAAAYLFENEYPTSILHFFKESAPYSEYASLSPYDRQQLILKKCIIDNADGSNYSKSDVLYDDKIDYDIITDQNNLSIHFSEQQDCEMYIYLKNLHSENGVPNRFRINVSGFYEGQSVPNLVDSVEICSPKSQYYGGKTDFLLCLGYTENPIDEIYLSYNNDGTFLYDDLVIYSKPKHELIESIESLACISADTKLSLNKLDFTVNSPDDGYIFIAIPYCNNGWKASIDGAATDIFRADDAFMAVKCPSGKHNLVLTYITPYYYSGLALFALFLIIFISMIILGEKKKCFQ